MRSPIRTVIVDDEPLARRRLVALLQDEPDVSVVAECTHGAAAIEQLGSAEADLLFLDVEMPDHSGFEVLRALGADRVPAVVFVTAYSHYAVDAFEIEAVDYLVKPFDRERFQATLDRVRKKLRVESSQDLVSKLDQIVSRIESKTPEAERLSVRDKDRILFVPVASVDWIEAAGNYVYVHAGQNKYMIRETLRELEMKLAAKKFARIHRSALVNLERVVEMSPWTGGDYILTLQGGRKLTLSRTYKHRLDSWVL